MALKDDIAGIKQEIGTEEQFLESIIKSELFIKKYKKPLIFFATLIMVIFVGYWANEFIQNSRINSANELYSELLEARDDAKLAKLKDKDFNLYALYMLNHGTADDLTALGNDSKVDYLLKEIISVQNGKQSPLLLNDYDAIVKGYELLKTGQIEAANAEFDKIAIDSPVRNLALNLKHYKGNK